MFVKSTLWFHKVNDNKWDINSYKKIVDLCDLDDFLYTYKMINNFSSGMFFLMKEGIKPVYEDPNNINGGMFSFKLSKKICKNFWYELSHIFLEGNITKDYNKFQYITGMSISPKTNNCIIKIWTNTCKNINVDILKDNIENKFLDECIFRKNKDAK